MTIGVEREGNGCASGMHWGTMVLFLSTTVSLSSLKPGTQLISMARYLSGIVRQGL